MHAPWLCIAAAIVIFAQLLHAKIPSWFPPYNPRRAYCQASNNNAKTTMCSTMATNGTLTCWCDDVCMSYQDCCSDIITTCLVPTISSVSPATPPTSGGTAVTITGNNFFDNTDGDFSFKVYGKSAVCSTISMTQLICTFPALTTSNYPAIASNRYITVTNKYYVAGNWTLNYATPTITSISPTSGPTGPIVATGIATQLTINGNNFGPIATAVVKIGNYNCTLVSQTHVQIICLMGGGAGSQNIITVTAHNTTGINTAVAFAYNAPTITSIVASSASTSGGDTLTITGTNFGNSFVSRSVTVGGSTCVITSSNTLHTQMLCTIPAGDGINKNVVVKVSDQSTTVYTFSYNPPKITSLSSTTGPTSGSTTDSSTWLTIFGENFGTGNASVMVTIGSTSVLTCSACTRNHTVMQVRVPPGEGLSNVIVITVAGQSNAATSIVYSYAAPTITTITPIITTSGNQIVTALGTSFGTSPLLAVDGTYYTVVNATQTSLTFRMPSGSGSRSVIVSHRSGASNVYKYTYESANITSISPTSPIPTVGGGKLTVSGSSFGDVSGSVWIASRTCSIRSWNHTFITCTIPNGVGAGLDVIVGTATGNTTVKSAVSYMPPSVNTSTTYSVSTAGGDSLIITGSNLGTISGSATVTINGRACLVKETIIDHTDTTLTCIAPSGTGTHLPIAVNVSGQMAAASDKFSYLPPSIISILPSLITTSSSDVIQISGVNFGASGGNVTFSIPNLGDQLCAIISWSHTAITCKSPGGRGANVPVRVYTQDARSVVSSISYYIPTVSTVMAPVAGTAGGDPLTITGFNFGAMARGLSVRVSGSDCPVQSVQPTQIVCALPVKTSTDHSVVVTADAQASTDSITFLYDAPTIVSITPTVSNLDPNLGASTNGTTIVTITGINFGASSVPKRVRRVSDGGDCTNVRTVTNHTRITCVVPQGPGGPIMLDVTVDTRTSSGFYYQYRRPVLARFVLPPGRTTLSTIGSEIVTLIGSDFGTSDAVVSVSMGSQCADLVQHQLSSCPCTISWHNQSMIVCSTPNGQGSTAATTVSVAGISSNALSLAYAAPTLVASTPTSFPTSGGQITITGSNLGTGIPGSILVRIGTVSCSSPTYINATAFSCMVGEGSGHTQSVSVQIAQQPGTNQLTVAYNAPALTAVTPISADTSAADVSLTITGTSLGSAAVSRSVLIENDSASFACLSPQVLLAHRQIACTLQAGMGRSLYVRVTVDGQTSPRSALAMFSFNPPVITSISPAHSSAAGSGRVTVSGTSFGSAGRVTINGTNCTAYDSYSDASITCAVPAGVGASLPVSLTVSNYPAYVLNGAFSYDPPVLKSVTSSSTSTSGSYSLTISGTNLGTDSTKAAVTVGGANCPVLTVSADTVMTCRIAAGSGKSLPVAVTVGSQPGTTTLLFTYGAPTVATVTSSTCTTQSGSGVRGCSVSTTNSFTITGTNFGVSGATATIGPRVCTPSAQTHTQLICSVSAWSDPQFTNLNVTVSVSGQSGTAFALVSYAGPEITSLHCAPQSCSALPVTNGNARLTITGTGFDAATLSNNVVQYGPISAPSTYSCNVTSATSTTLICAVPSGVGGNLTVTAYRLMSGFQLVSASTTSGLSYLAPVIRSGLRSFASDTPTTFLTAVKSQNQYVDFNVDNVGTWSDQVIVYLTSITSSSTSTIPCSSVQMVESGRISCLVGKGDGLNWHFVVVVAGQRSASGTDTFSYPVPAQVYSASSLSCSDSGNSTIDCPTEGSVPITIRGDYFTSNSTSVIIGPNQCDIISITPPASLVCLLSAGVGLNLPITVITGQLYSRSVNLVSYRAPTLTAIRGCVPGSDFTSILDCSRTLRPTITITGSDFGPANAIVFIGEDTCSDVVHDPSNAHRTLTCSIPSTSGTSIAVTVQQGGGQISTSSLYLSYLPCPAGYQDTARQVACKPCPAGTYSSLTGSISCILCPDGTASNATAATTCTSCPVGTFATSGARTCTSCPLGFYNTQSRQSSCTPCAEGEYGDELGQSACKKCAPGSANSDMKKTSPCSVCSAGTYADLTGSISCVDCPAGSVSTTSGSLQCASCAPGSVQSYTRQTSCLSCSMGTSQTGIGQLNCQRCDSGWYGNRSGLAECFKCAPGTYSRSSASGTGPSACAACAVGRYSPSWGQSQCLQCPVGTFRNTTGSWSCVQCPSGTYADQVQSTECKPCPIGQYSPDPGSAICISSCPAGRYSASTGKRTCDLCPAGSYQDRPGGTSCRLCKTGTASETVGQILCKTCPPGTYAAADGATHCLDCPQGRASATSSATSCSACPSGQYQNLTGQSYCLPCDPGTYTSQPGQWACSTCSPGTSTASGGSTSCTACPAGSYSGAEGQMSCVNCPLGRYASGNASMSCASCDLGTYQDASGQTLCKSCPPGTYANGVEQFTCADCEPGRYTALAGQSTCRDCPPGYYHNQSGQTECLACPAGTFTSGTAQSTCALCPTGRYSNQTGSVSCAGACLPGSYSGPGSTSCMECTPGFYSSTNESSACRECTPGRFRGAADTADSCRASDPGDFVLGSGSATQTACAPGRYQRDSGQSTCIDCDPGQYQPNAGWSQSCLRCRAGTYSTRASAQCQPCPVGRYSDDDGAKECKYADPGRYVANPGQNQSAACEAGQAQSDQGQSACTDCSPGSYADQPGSVLCKKCGPGTYQDATGAALPCLQCPVGTYSDELGLRQCLPCPIGSYGDAPAMVSCLHCQSGRYSAQSGNTVCDQCPAGFRSIAMENLGITSCDLCPAGRYQSSNGSSDCSVCAPGRYAPDPGSGDCLLCPPGRFQSAEGSWKCDLCPRGQYQPGQGAILCLDCIPGRYGNGSAVDQCVDCSAGFYQDQVGQGQCRPCPAGRFAKDTGRSECIDCGIGTYSGPGSDRCTSCPIGQYSNRSGLSSCSVCGPGQSTLRIDSDSCVPCDMGRYKSPDGSCQLCPAGTISDQQGSSECSDCPVGRYATEAGSTQCLACGQGRYANETRSQACQRCEPGTYAGVQASTHCEKCPSGSYADVWASSSCTICPAGTYQPKAHSESCLVCPAGTKSSAAATSCLPCPIGTTAVNGSADCTVCGPHLIAPRAGTPVCLACSPSSSPDSLKQACQCNPGYYHHIGNTPDQSCIECPFGSDCTHYGTTNATLYALDGYWRSTSGQFYRCLFASHCPSTATLSGECPERRTGPLCAVCRDGYYDTWGSSCTPCPARIWSFLSFACLTVLVCTCVAVQLFLVVRAGSEFMRMEKERTHPTGGDAPPSRSGQTSLMMPSAQVPARTLLMVSQSLPGQYHQEPRVVTSLPPNFMYKMKILLGFFQITTNLSSTLDVPWPPQYKLFLSWFSPLNFDLAGITMVSCVFPTSFYSTYISASTTPAVLVLAVTCIYYLPRRYFRLSAPAAQKRTRRRFWRMILFLLFLFYPGTSSIVLRLFNCVEVEGVHYLLSDVRTQCYTRTWYQYRNWSPLLIAAYPVGVPLFFIWAIYRVRHRLHEPGIKAQVGFLYDAFSAKFWWMDLVDNLHKLFLTSLLSFFGARFRTYQIPIGMAVTSIYTVMLLLLNPYQRKGDDRLHLLVQCAILMYMMAAQVFFALEQIDTTMNWTISIVMIFFTLGLIAFFLAQATLFLRKTFCPRRKHRAAPEPVYVEKPVDVAASADLRSLKPSSRKSGVDLALERQSVNPLYNQFAAQIDAVDDDLFGPEKIEDERGEIGPVRLTQNIENISRSLHHNPDSIVESLIARRRLDTDHI